MPESLTFALPSAPETRHVRGLRCGLALSDGTCLWAPTEAHLGASGEGARNVTLREGPIAFTWGWEPLAGGLVSRLSLRNEGDRPVHMAEAILGECQAARGGGLALGAPSQAWTFYQNGWMSWSPALIRPVHCEDRGDQLVTPSEDPYYRPHNLPQAPTRDRALLSSDVTLIGHAEDALCLGLLDPTAHVNALELETDAQGGFSRLSVRAQLDGVTLAPGETRVLPPVWWAWGRPEALLETYGRLSASPLPLGKPQGGWCTWYYFFGRNTQEDLIKNLVALGKHPHERLAMPWVLIDDGHQTAIGDWLSTDRRRYPQGMRTIAQLIDQAGHVPGLWLAPFCVAANSRLYAEHPDWVVQRADGPGPHLVQRHWDQPIYGLDLTHPAVLSHLRDLTRTLTRDWGFRVLKLDFLHFGAQPGRRHDADKTRLEAFRLGLSAIREAAGLEVHLLGCGAPLGGSLGLVDSMRIGQDVGLSWRGDAPQNMSSVSTYHACMNVVHRAWMQGHWWVNDPDCLITRTIADRAPGTDAVVMTEAEKRFLATVVALSGGSMISGDNLATLDAAGWHRTAQLLPPIGLSARWVDGLRAEFPEVLRLDASQPWEDWRLVALLNWSDAPAVRRLPAALLGAEAWWAQDVWEDAVLGQVTADTTFQLPAHGATLLALRPVRPHPWLLGDDRHWAQGLAGIDELAWDAGGSVLRLALTPLANTHARLTVSVPAGYGMPAIDHLGPEDSADLTAGILRLRLAISGPRRLGLRFAPG